MNATRAHKIACETSRRLAAGGRPDTVYVVYEPGEGYDTASAFDLETYFAGLRDENILAAYVASERLD